MEEIGKSQENSDIHNKTEEKDCKELAAVPNKNERLSKKTITKPSITLKEIVFF